MKKKWDTHILLFIGIVLIATFLYNGNQDVEAQDVRAGCLHSFEFSQGGNYANQGGGGGIGSASEGQVRSSKIFASVNPAIFGKVSSINGATIFGRTHIQNAGEFCTISLNGGLCATITGPVVSFDEFVFNLNQCPSGLNMNAYNTFTIDCSQSTYGGISIGRLAYDTIWNSCV